MFGKFNKRKTDNQIRCGGSHNFSMLEMGKAFDVFHLSMLARFVDCSYHFHLSMVLKLFST